MVNPYRVAPHVEPSEPETAIVRFEIRQERLREVFSAQHAAIIARAEADRDLAAMSRAGDSLRAAFRMASDAISARFRRERS